MSCLQDETQTNANQAVGCVKGYLCMFFLMGSFEFLLDLHLVVLADAFIQSDSQNEEHRVLLFPFCLLVQLNSSRFTGVTKYTLHCRCIKKTENNIEHLISWIRADNIQGKK